GVTGTNQHQHGEDHERDKSQQPKMRHVETGVHGQIGPEMLKKWNHQTCRIFAVAMQKKQQNGNQNGNSYLREYFGAEGKSKIAFVDDLDIVVRKTNTAKTNSRQNRQPDKRIREIAPQQRRHQHLHQNQQAAHGWRPRLFLMILWAVLANELTDLKLPQPFDQIWTDQQTDEQRGYGGKRGSEREVAKDAECVEVWK